MAKAYAMEFRRAVMRRYEECGSSDQAAEETGCSGSWVRRLVARERATGTLDPLAAKLPDNRVLTDADLARLRDLVAARPDLTLAELAAELGGKASVPTVWRATRRLGLTLKKSPPGPPSRTART
jgi:transposase